MTKKGFTLIELVVVIAILSLLTSMLLLYSRDSEKQLTLLREKAKLVSIILRAKSLAVQTLKKSEPVCGYGVHFPLPFETAIYRIFKDPKGAGGDCSSTSSNQVWNGVWEDVEVVDLTSTNVTLATSPSMTDVFFTPPDPKTLLSPGNLNSSTITLSITIGGAPSTASITINNGGQVSTQ